MRNESERLARGARARRAKKEQMTDQKTMRAGRKDLPARQTTTRGTEKN